jgi:hypothetical protein
MAKQFFNGYALLIAVDENAVPRWALPDVAKDVAALQEVLVHPERCAYPAANVRVTKGKEASRVNILEQLEWLEDRIAADASGNATAIVYYTGHGWRDEAADPDEFYLIPYDVREDKIRSRALRAADLADAIEALKPQRLLVVLDCCHAGGMGIKDLAPPAAGYAASAFAPVRLMSGEQAAAGPGAKGLEELAQGKGRAVLSSSTGEQRSYMRPDRKMSIFTYHLIEALTGHARPEEGATEVLVSDAMGHVYRHVPKSAREAWGTDQEPDFQVSGNFAIALLLGGKGWSKGLEPPDPLAVPPPAGGERMMHTVDTGGGAYIAGGVQVNDGDFVGRDKIQVDVIKGDKVQGDKFTARDISGSHVAWGRGAQATHTEGVGGAELAKLFAAIYQKIDARPADPDVDKEELAETVHKVEQEAAKGDEANPNKVERWLRFLGGMAPDILEVTVACLTNPLAGVGTVIRKIAEKARAEAQAAGV